MSESRVARSVSETPKRRAVERQPPSGKLVLLVLEREGELTSTEITEETLLPAGTVHQALQRLREERLVVATQSLRDGRVTVYESTVGE